jgi:transcriptional antiterminator RfaH
MSNLISGWCVIYTRPRFEKSVVSFLDTHHIHYYFPTCKSTRNWKDRTKIIEAALFPSYVFVYIEKQSDYFRSLECKGVVSFVKCGKEVVRIKDTLMETIKKAVSGNEGVQVADAGFASGQSVLIQTGALSGLMGEVVNCKGRHKVIIRLGLLNRSLLIDLPTDYLQSA